MTYAKLSLAALLLGASFAPALADEADLANSPVAVLNQSVAAPAGKIVEGRQATPIVATATHETGAARYLDNRVSDQDR